MNNVFTIVGKELKVFFRDKRTVFMTFAFPFILFPVIFNLMNFFTQKNKKELKTSVMKVLFLENVPAEVESFVPKDSNINIVKGIEGDTEKLLNDRKVQAIVSFNDNYEIDYLSSEAKSKVTANKMVEYIENYKKDVINKKITEAGLDTSLLKPFEISKVDKASKARKGGMFLGRILPYLIMIMLFSGAMGFGLEATTGEKEKGTIATLLVSQASRVEIVVGKLIYLVILELANGIANVGAFAFASSTSALFKASKTATESAAASAPGLSFAISPATMMLLLILIIPIGIIAAALIITLGSYAKSMKEGQTMSVPILFIFIFIGMISMTAPIKVPEYYFYIPLVNTSFAMQELLTFKFNMAHYLLTIGTTVGFAGLLTFISIWFFNRENIHFRN